MNDEFFMKKVLKIARLGLGETGTNPLVGAIIVENNNVTGKGYYRESKKLHAIPAAIQQNKGSIRNSVVYTNIEPCSHHENSPSCVEFLIQNKPKKVIIGSLNPSLKISGKSVDILRNNQIEVKINVLNEQCLKLNEVYFKYIKTGLPFVTVKFAQSLDGRIASKTGNSQWISSETSLKLAHHLRSIHHGLMVGIGTILKDDPRLTVRLTKGNNPYRIIVDSSLRIPLKAKIFRHGDPQKIIIAVTSKAKRQKIAAIERLGARVFVIEKNSSGQVDLKKLLPKLGEMGISSIMVEGGAQIITSLLKFNLVDKFMVVISPKIIGKGIEAIGDLGINEVNHALKFSEYKIRKSGADFLFEGRPDYSL